MQLNNFTPNYKFHFIEKERTLVTSDQTDMLADRLLWKIKKEIWKNASNYGKKIRYLLKSTLGSVQT